MTREEAVAIAYGYTQIEWLPEQRHVRHGPDADGIVVHTPDVSLTKHGHPRGWWQPGVPAKGMPYQWGGFDTPESFEKKLARGFKAGDAAIPSKRRMGDAGTSAESAGIDCSGFVSCCWKLKRPYSTRELASICDPLEDWHQLRAGDILLNDRHVILYVRPFGGEGNFYGYEAGPFPVWRVNASAFRKANLLKDGYRPWRYRRMTEEG